MGERGERRRRPWWRRWSTGIRKSRPSVDDLGVLLLIGAVPIIDYGWRAVDEDIGLERMWRDVAELLAAAGERGVS
jgi:hypothetical protein